MKNIKGISVVTDGNSKRLAIIFDEIDEAGKVTNSNVRVNRIIVDDDKLDVVKQIENIAQDIIEAE